MPKTIPQHGDEIDLLEIILTIFNNKLKIFIISFVIVFLSFGIQMSRNSAPVHLATTEIRPISTFDELEYNTYNLYFTREETEANTLSINNEYSEEQIKIISGILKKQKKKLSYEFINREYLIRLFVEELKENTIFKTGIKKFSLIKKEDYEDSKSYEDAVTRLASYIEFLPPNDDIKKGNIEPYWRIRFETENIKLWEEILKDITGPSNEVIRLHLNDNHKKLIESKKKLKKFNIEDIELRMSNAILNYEKVSSRRLIYLKEQAKIARKLNVAKNSYLEPQSINTGNAVITTLIAKTPDYMRGYEMIEEEIKLIKKRNVEDKKAFIKNFSLLENLKEEITNNKDIERLEQLFKSTPAYEPENFYAAKIMFQSTVYENLNEKNNIKMLLLYLIIGLIIGIFYVMTEKAIKKGNKRKYYN